MGILILRFIAVFYVIGLLYLIISLLKKVVSPVLVNNKRSILGLVFFPVLLITSQGRKFLKEIIKGE